jgi:GrpB-like predicted nucleotidyltransferase (UPF0157 family)/predicted acetyltransferase
MHALRADPDVARWLGGPHDRERARELLERHMEHEREHGFALWAVVERASGEVIGHCGLQHLEGGPEIEVGWALLPSRWGRGYATEAARTAVAFGFDTVGLDEIVAVTLPDNDRSRRVMEKLGMTYAGRGVYFGHEQVKYALRRLPEEPVVVADYDAAWPRLFEEERAALAAALGGAAVAIEHVGSTAVPGLAAKPIVDILVGLRSYPAAAGEIAAVEAVGYVYRGELGIPGRQFFARGRPRTHVHATLYQSDFWRSHLLFRDYLRASPEDAARYAALKRELAVRYREDRTGYTESKDSFVADVLARASGSSHSPGKTGGIRPG